MGTHLIETRALLLDMDNTLYDWLGYYGPALRGMCSRLSELTGCSSSQLYEELKDVFTEHSTVEYSFAIQELPSVQSSRPDLSGAQLAQEYFGAIAAFQRRRRSYLRLYPGVRAGLQLARSLGLVLFAVTDARRFQAIQRLQQLRIFNLFHGICCVTSLRRTRSNP